MSAAIINRTAALFIILVLLLLSGAAARTQAAPSIPNFVLPSVVDGREVNSDEFQGKVLLVTVFATWCGPCREEIPALIRLQNELSGKGFSVLALSVDTGGTDIVRKLVEKNTINYPVLLSNRETIAGFGRISFIPTTFLVNRNREIIKKYRGNIPYQQLQRDITSLLLEPQSSVEDAEKRKNVIIIRQLIIL